ILGPDTNLVQSRHKPELVELAHSVRQQVDTSADRANILDGFVDPAVHADLVQAESQNQTAGTSASNDDFSRFFHKGSPVLFRDLRSWGNVIGYEMRSKILLL